MRVRGWPLGVLAASFAGIFGACSFPDVGYDDAGAPPSTSSSASTSSSSSGAGGGCAAPPACATAATSCAQNARSKHNGCVHPCKQDMACIAACNTTLQTELESCAAACDSCVMAPCADCKALVGL